MAVAGAAGVTARRDAMFAGEPINTSEHRAVLHVALRARRLGARPDRASTARSNVVPEVHEVLGAHERLRRLGAQWRRGAARRASASAP